MIQIGDGVTSEQEESKTTPLGHRGRHDLVRQHNQRVVLRAIYEAGPSSRASIAAATGLSKPTAGALVEQLTNQGHLKIGLTAIEGRDREVFAFADGIGLAMGVTIEAIGIRASLTDITGERRVDTKAVETPTEPKSLLEAVRSTIAKCLSDAGAEPGDLRALTLSIPGAVQSTESPVAYSATVPALQGMHLADQLALDTNARVSIENDANLAALGEGWRGAATGVSDYAAVFIGSGIGMGIVSGGTILRGAHGSAGEIAFLPIGTDPRREPARARGAFELAATESAGNDSIEGLVAQAILAVQAILDPALIVLGGPTMKTPDFATGVRKALDLISPFSTPVVNSLLGLDAVLMGAVAHARRALLDTVLG